MSATLTFPGVYLAEAASAAHTIVGVATSITAVTMQCVLAAVRNEFHKLGRPANGADFRLLGDVGVAA